MSTISAKIRSILCSPLNAAQFELEDNKADIQKIDVADLDQLAANVTLLRDYVVSSREALQEVTRVKLEAFLKANSDLGITSVEGLLESLSGSVSAPVVSTSSSKTAKDNNTKFTVYLRNPETDKNEEFVVLNKKLSKKITEHPTYKALVAKDKTMLDVDAFLREYAPEYKEKYPINAKWKTKTFHLNTQGPLNRQAKEFYEELQKTKPEATKEEFSTLVMEAYKKV